MKIKNKKNVLLSELMPQGNIAERILNERAKYLSEPVIDQAKTGQLTHYVRFKLGEHEYYGIPFQYMKEVMLNVIPTKVPHTPDYIAGIINRQGALLTILDLKPFFHIKSTEDAKKSHLLVITVHGITIALLADDIEGSDHYDPTMLDAPIATENAIKPNYIAGLHHGTIAILNIETLIADLQLNITPLKENK